MQDAAQFRVCGVCLAGTLRKHVECVGGRGRGGEERGHQESHF